MQEAFYKSAAIAKEDLGPLMQKQDRSGIARLLILVVLFMAASYFIIQVWQGPWWMILFAHICFGIMCCNSFACLHESAHGTAFKSKWLGRVVAQIAGILHIYPVSTFRSLHFTHHRHTHIPGLDPEISIGNKPAPALLANLPIYFAWISGLPLLLFKISMMMACVIGLPEFMRKGLFPFIKPEKSRSVAFDSMIVLIVYISIIYLALTVNAGFWGIISGQVVGHCMLATYLVMEHNGLPHEGHILAKTRSINTNRFIKYIMWNMPYHAEHHAFPAVPFHALPLLHKAIKSELLHKKDGIGSLHLKMFKGDFREGEI